jgi:hypothetical protein
MSMNAFAAKINVMSIDESFKVMNASEFSLSFNANLENGNAWVEAITPSAEDYNGVFERSRVDGLSLQGDSIVLDTEGQQVVCATVSKTRIFGTTKISATGNCKLSVKRNKKIVDDGYNGVTEITYDITLETL